MDGSPCHPERQERANVPPLITVPVGAVVMEATWQVAQPICVKICCPACASGVASNPASTGGTLGAADERRKLVDVVIHIFRIGRRLAKLRRIDRVEAAGNSCSLR